LGLLGFFPLGSLALLCNFLFGRAGGPRPGPPDEELSPQPLPHSWARGQQGRIEFELGMEIQI